MYHEISSKPARERKGDWTFQMILINYLVHANDCCSKRTKLKYCWVLSPLQQCFPLLYQGFRGYLAFILERTGENSTARDCLQFLVICVPFKTEKRFPLLAEESNTTAIILSTEPWSGLGYQEGALVSVQLLLSHKQTACILTLLICVMVHSLLACSMKKKHEERAHF